ncbi:MAG TPA: hypothetical protein VFZ68_09945 [Acidimicrobiales bacterium]
MSSPFTDPRDPDELASALLDGELPPAEAEAAAGDPEVRQRLAVLRATRDALRADDPAATGEPPRPERRAAAIGRALAAYDAVGAAPVNHDAAAGAREVTSGPGAIGTLRRAGGARPVRWLSAAAAVLVLAGMIALISLASGPDATDDATVADSAGRATERAEPPTAEVPEAGDGALADDAEREEDSSAGALEAADDLAVAPAAPVDLGTPASTDVLVARAAAAVDEAGVPPPAAERAPSAAPGAVDEQLDRAECDAARARGSGPLSGDQPLLEMTAVLDGERLWVWAYADGADLRILALDESCRVVVDRIVHR